MKSTSKNMNVQTYNYYLHDNVIHEDKLQSVHPFYSILGKAAFFIFFFFVIFGTKLPFRENAGNMEEMTTSNITTQIVIVSVFILAVISIIPRLKTLGSYIIKEKFLLIFLGWALLTILWSDYSFVSFKRWFQVFAAYIVIFAGLVHVKDTNDLLRFFKILFAVYVIVNLAAIFTIPAAIDKHNYWQGIATQKNELGQTVLAAVLVWIFSLREKSNLVEKFFYSIMLFLSLVLLFGTQSSTSVLTLVILIGIWLLFYLDQEFKKIGAGRLVSLTIIFSSIIIIAGAIYMIPEKVNDWLGLIGEDLSFTGRTDLWGDILNEVKNHWLLGTGYQGFWVFEPGNQVLYRLYDIYIWIPQQAHNGYIDILNETGLIGLILFLTMVIYFFMNVNRSEGRFFWKWFFVAALIINIQESSLFRPGILSFVMFLLAYMALFMNILKNNEKQNTIYYETDTTSIV